MAQRIQFIHRDVASIMLLCFLLAAASVMALHPIIQQAHVALEISLASDSQQPSPAHDSDNCPVCKAIALLASVQIELDGLAPASFIPQSREVGIVLPTPVEKPANRLARPTQPRAPPAKLPA